MFALLLFAFSLLPFSEATPAGMITFFQHRPSCPVGWTQVGQGRMIVSVTDPKTGGVTVGVPLGDKEDRNHSHTISGKVTLDKKEISAASGKNQHGACHDSYPVGGEMNVSSSNLPLAQVLMCQLNKEDNNPVPFGSVAFFSPNLTACPDEWIPFGDAAGRYIVPGWASTGTYISAGTPLSSGEVRTHRHSWSVRTRLLDVSYVGIRGCCLDTLAEDDFMYNITGETVMDDEGSGSSELPYLQLLTCVSTASTFDFKQPQGAMIFNQIGCPPGMNVSVEYAGRFLVGLPDGNATAGNFGSTLPLQRGATETRSHRHDLNATFTTRSCGVALASGCCGFGYVKDDEYSFTGKSDMAAVDFPYIEVPLCASGLPIPV